MSYEDRIEQVKQIIADHNQALGGEGKDGYVDWEKFLADLRKTGGIDEVALALCSWEELKKIGLPQLLAKKVANAFREKADGASKQRRVSPQVAARMLDEELISAYNPREHDNAVGSELLKRTQGKRCIVFNPDGTVNVEISKNLLEEIRDNHDERTTFIVDARPQKTYRVGERPDMVSDENPLYTGRILRPDGTCDQTNRSWDGVPFPVRAIIYLAVTETHEIPTDKNLMDAHTIMDLAMREDAGEVVRQRFSDASMRYDELEGAGQLPPLKIIRNTNGGGANNPALASSGTNREF